MQFCSTRSCVGHVALFLVGVPIELEELEYSTVLQMEGRSIIHFDPFVSRVEAGFWHELAQRKLEKYKLSEAEQIVRGSYSNGKL